MSHVQRRRLLPDPPPLPATVGPARHRGHVEGGRDVIQPRRAGSLIDAEGLDHPATSVTPAGAAWLVSAAHRRSHDTGDGLRDPLDLLPCGTVFDVVNAPGLFGRCLLERLWSAGPGSGPVAAHRGRVLLFTAPGTAHRLPALLRWEEWGGRGEVRAETIPPLLYHGMGDAVTVPPSHPGAELPTGCRWLVAPDVRHPWLPGPEVLLWACVRAARAGV